jgi:glycosyltransferase involved in cell wall biosynthesis
LAGTGDGIVDVVLPVLDEAGAIPWVLERMPPGYRAIVVDNGSSDGSADIAEAGGATVVREGQRGFGAACHAGLLAATAPVVAFMDCDASLDPGSLPVVVAPVDEGRAELVVGARVAERGAWPPHARLANRYLAHRLNRRFGWTLGDPGPMRAGRREALVGLGIEDRRSGWPLEMLVRAGHAGWRVVGVDVPYHPRVGRSKVTGTLRGTVTAVTDQRRQLRHLGS